MTVQRIVCTSCGRTVLARGPARIIEAARTLAGDEPAEEYLAQLESSSRPANLARLADIAIVFEEFARRGQLREPLELNHLEGRLWEIKARDTRFPFYDLQDADHVCKVVRLTHGFPKRQQKTPKGEIRKGLWVISQDEKWSAGRGDQAAVGSSEQAAIEKGGQVPMEPGGQAAADEGAEA